MADLKLDRKQVKAQILEALQEIYHVSAQSDGLSDKQKAFLNLAIRRIFGDSPPKPKKIKVRPPADTRPLAERTAVNSAFFECEACHKQCNSKYGLTLHKKQKHPEVK
jgi:hypothetical protein